MEDGFISDDEHVHIEHLQHRFNLSDEYARAIMTAIYEQEKKKILRKANIFVSVSRLIM